MSLTRRFAARMRGLVFRGRLDRELDAELQFHLEMQAEDNARAGMDLRNARDAAARSFGGVEQIKERHRERRSFAGIESIFRDLHYALRTMRGNPGFTATAVLSLALGIGANTAIFSLIDAILLRSLPVGHPERLVQIVLPVSGGRPTQAFSYPLVRDLAARAGIFEGLAGFSPERFETADGTRTLGAYVSGGYFATLRLVPIAGRLLTEADDHSGEPPVAVISDGYWARRFGRDPRAIGQSIRIEHGSATIVGVSPPGFEGMDVAQPADITLAIAATAQLEPGYRTQTLGYNYYGRQIVARLRDDVPIAQARSEAQAKLAVVWPQAVRAATPYGNKALLAAKPELLPAGNGWTDLRPQFQKPLLVLMGIAGAVLLIACANLANLLLARSTARQREIAVRLAIGAGRGRVVRQLLTESVLLAVTGAVFGLAIAWLGSRFLVELLSSAQRIPITLDVAPNAHILLFASLAAVATTLLFGLAPAFRATAQGPAGALKDNAAHFTRRQGWLASALVIAQVSLSLLLLIGAGVFIRTLLNLKNLDAGFRRDGVLIAEITAPAGFKGPQLNAFFRELPDRARRLPGVVSVGLSDNTPLRGLFIRQEVRIPGRPPGEYALRDRLGPGYFETLRTPLLQGRDFTFDDSRTAPGVVIVNQAFVREFFPSGNALGQHVNVGEDLEIVGIVGDVRSKSLREPGSPAMYCSMFQGPLSTNFTDLVVRSSGSLSQLAAELRREFSLTDRTAVHALDEQVEKTLIQERLMASLAGAFGALALILAMVGLYGLLAYTVSRRTHEVGIRMALGAKQSQVLWMVIKDALALLAAGAALGIPLAWPLSRLVSSLAFGLTPADPSTIAVSAAMLVIFGIVAAFVPARRAARVEPMNALRVD
jgi:putative ABC transport system permease protein